MTSGYVIGPVTLLSFSVYTAQVPGCSTRNCLRWGPGLSTLLRSLPAQVGYSTRHRLSGPVLCPTQILSSSGCDQVLGGTLSPGTVHLVTFLVPAARFLEILPVTISWCAVGLLWRADLAAAPPVRLLPSWVDLVSNWKPCSHFGKGCHLWGRVCPFQALATTCLPSCLRWGMGGLQLASSSDVAQSLCSGDF